MTASSRFITYIFFLGVVQAKFAIVQGDCWYDNRKHEENSEVPTGEPCLNCTCSRSVLLCYLRVCPKLPNPPPPGCILLHRFRSCCPELICSDFYDGGNSLEARADPEGDLDLPSDDQSAYKNACISNGSIYGPGSAMHSSSLCEYCYCLTGKQVCVKPKCLLPIEGCSPIFEETSCCPVRYNCLRKPLPDAPPREPTTLPTTSTSSKSTQKGACSVEGVYYQEGSRVIGVGHSACDNCYCLRGLLRCEPLSCAPPLLGCTPMVKPGECCAASYNCNGTLEIEPEPNYGLFPTISKEYSQFRKEVQRKPPSKQSHRNRDGIATAAPFYVLAETLQEPTTKLVYQRSPDTYGTTRQFSGASFKPSTTQQPTTTSSTTIRSVSEGNFYLISSSNQRSTTEKQRKIIPDLYYSTNMDYKKVFTTTSRSIIKNLPTGRVRSSSFTPKSESSDYLGFGNLNILSIVDSLLSDSKMYRKVDEEETTDTYSTETPSIALDSFTNTPRVLDTTIETTDATVFTTNNLEYTSLLSTEAGTVDYSTATTTEEETGPVTVTTIKKSSDCINGVEHSLKKGDEDNIEITTEVPLDPAEINRLAESRTDFVTTTDFDTEDTSSDRFNEDITVPNVWLRNNIKMNGSKLQPDIEALLNISKHRNGDDFDYDYNEPTLPPSLPNLKIIPFVAADALDAKKESPRDPTPIFIEDKIDIGPLEYSSNMFKPPVETEGGFVPKEPLILNTFYNNGVSAPSITIESNEQNKVLDCILNGQEIPHGTPAASDSPCMTCACFYGNVVCQKSNCPPPKPGCKVQEPEVALCCPNYVCDTPMSPPLEIPGAAQEIVTVAEGIIPSDPFKTVIRTEMASNLQSLIGDKVSFQKDHGDSSNSSTTEDSPATVSSKPKPKTTTPEHDDDFGFDKVLQFIFSGTPDVIEKPISQNPSASKSKSTSPSDSSTTTSSNLYVKIDPVEGSNKLRKKSNLTDITLEETTSKAKTQNTNATAQVKSGLITEINTGQNSIGVGLLKLAGCNIYGRMYRVGRIISELSGPCLECKCTEIGVQCRQLRCSTGASINNN